MKGVLYKNPWVRIFLPLVLTGIINFLANILANEISINNKINWLIILQKPYLFIIAITMYFLGLYEINLFKADKEIVNKFSEKDYETKIRNNVSGNVAKRLNKLIKKGQIDQLKKETEIYIELYGVRRK